jgi:kumamolisin
MQKAFGVDLGLVAESSGNQYLSHREAISIPQSLSNLVTAVLGLDQRPVAKPRNTSKA